jgi:hypothetical protein
MVRQGRFGNVPSNPISRQPATLFHAGRAAKAAGQKNGQS